MNKSKFLYNLNDFQDSAVKELINTRKKVIIKSKMFTGKSTIAGKLFKTSNDSITIYHTGCSPELFLRAKNDFIEILKKYENKEIIVILDEFYDLEILEYINKIKNVSCYVFTNDSSLQINNFVVFDYYHFYKNFIINEIGKELDIHAVMNDNKNFSKEKEYLRRSSKKTTTYIKENNKIIEKKLEI